jgi:hypothetical protein
MKYEICDGKYKNSSRISACLSEKIKAQDTTLPSPIHARQMKGQAKEKDPREKEIKSTSYENLFHLNNEESHAVGTREGSEPLRHDTAPLEKHDFRDSVSMRYR